MSAETVEERWMPYSEDGGETFISADPKAENFLAPDSDVLTIRVRLIVKEDGTSFFGAAAYFGGIEISKTHSTEFVAALAAAYAVANAKWPKNQLNGEGLG